MGRTWGSIGIHSKHLPPLRRLQCKQSLHTSRKNGCQSTLCHSKPRRLPPCARVIQADHLTTSTETIPIEPDAVGRCHGDKEASGSFPRLSLWLPRRLGPGWQRALLLCDRRVQGVQRAVDRGHLRTPISRAEDRKLRKDPGGGGQEQEMSV